MLICTPGGLQPLDVAGGGILHALVGMMDLGPALGQRLLQGLQRQVAVQMRPRCQPRRLRVNTSSRIAR